ncbi:MAG TPA: hypothetical protein DF613_06535 [Lachnospiraceae bacterium]|nr:hypothetical protein [Lachnospiraceae bacterium]
MDSGLMRFLTLIANLAILNVLFIVCSLPVVTFGASLTALNYVVLQMIRQEDSYIVRGFFRGFKQNFLQATIIWLILLAGGVFLWLDYWSVGRYFTGAMHTVMLVGLTVLAVMWVMVFLYVFALQARYENTVKQTMKNALFMALLRLPYTVVLVPVNVLLPLLPVFLPQTAPMVLFVWMVCGFAAVAYVGDLLVNRAFLKTFKEEREMQEQGE